MPLDYRHVKDMYDQLKSAGAVSESLPEWSEKMNQATGTEDYSAATSDPFGIKWASAGIDKLLEMSGIPSVTGAIGRGAGELLGIPEAGEQIGRDLPRDIVDIAPWAFSAFGPPGVAAGAALSSGLSGAKAYTDTGSTAAGVLAGGLNLAMPVVGGLARNVALKKLGAELVEGPLLQGAEKVGVDRLQQLAQGVVPKMVDEYVPTTLGQAAGGFAAEQAAQTGLNLAGNAAQTLYSGDEFHWDPREELLGAVVGNLPFAGMSIARHGMAGFGGEAARRHIEETNTAIGLTRKAQEEHLLAERVAEQTSVEGIPDVLEVGPEFADRNTKINELRTKQRMASEDGTTFSEEDRQKMMAEEDDLVKAQGQQKGNVFGAQIDAETPRRTVYGSEVVFDPETGFRRIQASEDPRNAELAGKQIGYDTVHEPTGNPGEYSVPVGYHSEFLPTDPATGKFDPDAKLNIAQQKVAAAKSNVDLHDAVVELNGVRKSYGLAPVDDVSLTRRQADFELGGVRDAVQSEIERTRGVSKAKDVGQELTRLEAEGRRLESELEAAKAAKDDVAAAAHQAALDEVNRRHTEINPIREGVVDKERTRDIANAPMSRENAPAKDRMHENAVTITEGTEHKDSQAKFLTWAQNGRNGLKIKYGMSEPDMAAFMEQPEVQAWRDTLELSMAGGVPLQEYSQRYLKNVGLSDEQAKAHTGRVMDLADKGDAVVGHLLNSELVDPAVRKSAADMDNALRTDAESAKLVTDTLNELGHKSVDELYNEMLRSGKIDTDALHMMPPAVAEYIAAKARDHEHAMNVLDGAGGEKTQGDTFVPEDTKGAASDTLSSLGKVLDADRERGDKAAELSGLDTVVPQNWMLRTMRGLISDPMQLLGDTIKGAKDYLKTLNYLNSVSPELQEYNTRAHQLDPNTKKMYTEGLKIFALDKDGKEQSQQYMKALRDPATVNALDKWIGLNMRRGQENGAITMLSSDDAGVQRILRGLPDEKRQNVIDLMNKTVHSIAMNNAQRLEKMENVAVVQGAEMLNDVMGLKAKQNEQLSEAVMRGMKNPADEQAQRLSLIALEKIAQRDDGAAAKLVDFMRDKAGELEAQRKHDAENPALVSSSLYGKWDVTYKKGGREYFTRVDSKAAAEGLGEIVDIRRNETDGDTPVSYEPKGLREDAKWFENHISATKKDAASWTRALYKVQTEFLLGSVELKDRPDLQRMISEHHAMMLTPDPEPARKVTKLASSWLLGGNVATAMINGTQMFTRGAAELTRLTGNPLASWRAVMSSLKEIGEQRMGKQWRSPDHEWLVKRWESERDASAYDVGAERPVSDDISLQLKKMLFTGRPQSVGERADGLLNNLNKVSMFMFRSIEDVNTMSAMLSGFDQFRKQKLPDGTQMTREEAYRKASEFNQAVNDVGGKTNRPIMLYSKMPKSAAMLASALQSYNIGSVGQMVKLMKQGWGSSMKHLTPAERYNAKIATAQLLGVQFGLAGMMGMPFAGSTIAVLNQLFPQLELNKNLRSLTQQLFNEDEQHDSVLADIAANGIPSMFGWDFQSRLSMGNTVPGVSEINGFQPEIVFGPSYRIISDFVQGGKKLVSGDLAGFGDMTPPALKKLWEAYKGDGKVRDYQGRPLAGGDRTWGELTGQVIGFQPTRLTEMNKMNRIRKQSESEQRKRDQQFNQDLGQDIVDGKIGTAIQKLRDRQAQEPEYDIQDGGRKAADAALDLHFPRDLRKELNKKDTVIARLLPVYHDTPTEQERHDARTRILQRLGVRTRKSDEAYYNMMSAVEAENPEFTRYQIKEEAQGRLGKIKKQQMLNPTAEDEELAGNF